LREVPGSSRPRLAYLAFHNQVLDGRSNSDDCQVIPPFYEGENKMSEPKKTTEFNNEKPDYETEAYEREERDSDYDFHRFADYYGNNRRG
jgi:hypothetical protein